MVKYDIIKINNKNVRMVPKGITNMKFSQELDKAVAKIKERVEREVPDTGYFRNFAEDFANTDDKLCAKAVSLSVERDENVDGNALLLVSVLHPFMNIDASSMLACGKRDKILEYMNKDGFKDEVMRKIRELADSFM